MKQYDFGRNDEIAKQIDRIAHRAELEIDAIYGESFLAAVRRNRAALRELRPLLDGDIKPPAWCVLQWQKDRWLEKKLKAQSRGLDESFTAEEMRAGQEAVQIIQRMTREIYETAYGRTLEELGDV